MEFYTILDNEMKLRHLSNYQLSKDTGISDSLIGYWRTGKRKPTLDNLILLSKYFNVTIDYLVFGSQDNSILFGNNSLSTDENELISTYNQLDRRGQHRVHTIIYEELDRIESQNTLPNADALQDSTYEFTSAPSLLVAENTFYNASSPISVLGYVAAGEPILSYENAINTIIPETPKASYALIAKGNSMEPIIMNGEIIEVIAQKQLENGEIGIIKVDGAVTCKCFYSLEQTYELRSLNPEMNTIVVPRSEQSNVQILGKVALTNKQNERYKTL